VSLLTLIQEAADLIGIPRPTQVVASTDTQTRQLLALAKVEGRRLSRRHNWTGLMREATITTLAAEDQGVLTTLCPGIRFLANDTGWNRSTTEPLGGPLGAHEWQSLKAFTVTGPYYDYRVREGNLYFIPAPPAGDDVRLEYLSSYYCESSGGTDQSNWAADDDVGVLDEELMTAGVRWRFLRAKGMDYAEEFQEYEEDVQTAIARDGGRRVLYADAPQTDDYPTIRAPVGSWNL
jgi:hypothetical protein